MKTTTDHTALLNGYFGHVNQVLTLEDGRELVEIHITDCSEWECGEWYIEGERICLCDGYNGREWEKGFDPTEEIDGLVTSYEICGLLEEGIASVTKDAEEDDTDVRIEVTPQYYNDNFASRPTILKDEDTDEDRFFETVGDAQEWIDDQESQTYYLEHNEASRPNYRIVK